MAVLNNNYSDGVVWHDVACHFRSVIVCEDSDQLIALVQQQNAVDVSDTVKKGEDSRLVDPDAVIAEEERHEAELAALAARRPPRRPQGKYCLLSLNPRSNKQTICVFVCFFHLGSNAHMESLTQKSLNFYLVHHMSTINSEFYQFFS